MPLLRYRLLGRSTLLRLASLHASIRILYVVTSMFSSDVSNLTKAHIKDGPHEMQGRHKNGRDTNTSKRIENGDASTKKTVRKLMYFRRKLRRAQGPFSTRAHHSSLHSNQYRLVYSPRPLHLGGGDFSSHPVFAPRATYSL